jgi:hypothetical protein
MNTRMRLVFGLTGTLLVTGSLSAADLPFSAQDIRFGLQGTVAFPTSDLGDKGLLDKSLGYGLGAHALVGFSGGHALVPRLDYTYFEKSAPTRKVQTLQLGADYNYFFSQKVNEGLYVGGGLGLGLAKFEVELPGASADDTPKTGYGSVFAGCMFTPHMGAELRYTYAKYKPELFGAKPEVTAPTVQGSFIYRF